MNKPKSLKRFDLEQYREKFRTNFGERDGHYGLAIENVDVACRFALFVTEFTHLEHALERLAAFILETSEENAAHILRSIASAKARLDLLKNVLEKARHNARKSASYDEFLSEFMRLNALRNKIVHARFMTAESGEVFWLPRAADPMLLDLVAYEPFDVGIITDATKSITDLYQTIYRLCADEMEPPAN